MRHWKQEGKRNNLGEKHNDERNYEALKESEGKGGGEGR